MNDTNPKNNPTILSYIFPKEYTSMEPTIPTEKAMRLICSEKHIYYQCIFPLYNVSIWDNCQYS